VREQGTGNREQGTGNREQGTEKRFRATLLFVTYVGFFPFTYLVVKGGQDTHQRIFLIFLAGFKEKSNFTKGYFIT
jgi:hypothetical protein